ncbi:SPFH domain-containing protein [Nocardioides humi]|uniref:SPFH domain-containing protein n=1 Tax=Nocardioides humi TaxID=449461 RepID=A0ABN1ZSQ2_9ACTN|nr:SPFH domain-containing protein [Nocardioides humi]
MSALVLTVLLLLGALALAVTAPRLRLRRWMAVVPALLGVVVLVSSATTIVEAKNVGVVTTFGKPRAAFGPGLHLKAPWEKVTELDGTIQTQEYSGDGCIRVRIGDGTTACVTTTIRWRIVGEKADEIYSSYRSDDVNANVRKALVSTVFKAAVNQVLGGYDPTEEIRVIDPTAENAADADFAPDYDAMAAEIGESMSARVTAGGSLIRVETITLSYLELSQTTQKKINDFQAEVANTQVALQRKATAEAQAAANKALAESVSQDPNVLVSRCLDTLQLMVEDKQPVPAGFSCWPGGGSAVVLPQASR